jgi:predicted branched-subunit amino acid permease
MTHVLADGGSALVAVLAACTINLRMVLYSASLAPHLARERLGRRLLASYVLTDQAFAVSITRWRGGDDPGERFAYFVGAGFLLWGVWQISTLGGVLVGGSVPQSLQLDFAIPLVFLVLLVPTITDRPSVVAAIAGGAGAVIGAELGAGDLSILTGAVSGIVAGVLAERHRDGPAGRADGADRADDRPDRW